MTTVSLGDRMKGYEAAAQTVLTPRMPMIIRIDGRAFHTYTKAFEKPWSSMIKQALTDAADALLAEISGAKVAYCQSDECSMLVTDYDKLDSLPWFGKGVQKIASVIASIATVYFNDSIRRQCYEQFQFSRLRAMFDARCFVMPREDVNNYFLWRQRDASRNSVAMLGQAHFSHTQLHGKNGNQIQEMLFSSKGINYNDLETWKKRGWCVWRETYESAPEVFRTKTIIDDEIPEFSKQTEYIQRFVDVDEQPPGGGENGARTMATPDGKDAQPKADAPEVNEEPRQGVGEP